MTITSQIRKVAFETLERNPHGLRFAELIEKILHLNNSFNRNTIRGSIWDLDLKHPDKIYKPDRGVFRLLKYKEVLLTNRKKFYYQRNTQELMRLKKRTFTNRSLNIWLTSSRNVRQQ